MIISLEKEINRLILWKAVSLGLRRPLNLLSVIFVIGFIILPWLSLSICDLNAVYWLVLLPVHTWPGCVTNSNLIFMSTDIVMLDFPMPA